MTKTKSQRTFTVSKAIIRNLVNSQAGTLEKAIAECVMNSIDAAATSIDIDLTRNAFTIRDNGQGFGTREEILECFEVFGFDHDVQDDKHKRIYGQFGIGRAQLWAYASTIWRTRTFQMDVDIRSRGLEYELAENLQDVQGLVIQAVLYTELTNLQHTQVEEGLARLCKYCTVPVTLNGKLISVEPAREQWDIETDDAYVRIAESRVMRVYNQGIFVCEISAGRTGVGGVIVTKRARRIMLNMSRNMVLEHECPLWKQMVALCKAEANKRVVKEKTKRMTSEQRDYLAMLTADPAELEAAIAEPLFTLCNNRNIRWSQLRWKLRIGMPITVAGTDSRIGERLIQNDQAIVLARATLERFASDTVSGFLDQLHRRFTDAADYYAQSGGDTRTVLSFRASAGDAAIQSAVFERIQDVPAYKEMQSRLIPHKEQTRAQAAFCSSMGIVNVAVHRVLCDEAEKGGLPSAPQPRNILIGQSDSAEAYTDGSTYIAICDSVVTRIEQRGLSEYRRAVHILVHEYLHDSNSAGSHIHDHDFYEAFHNILLTSEYAERIDKRTHDGFRLFVKALDKKSKKHARQLDAIEQRTDTQQKAMLEPAYA